jgi:hypothetical protein
MATYYIMALFIVVAYVLYFTKNNFTAGLAFLFVAGYPVYCYYPTMPLADMGLIISGYIGIGILMSIVQVMFDISDYKKRVLHETASSYFLEHKWLKYYKSVNLPRTITTEYRAYKLSAYISLYIIIWPLLIIDWIGHRIIQHIGAWVVENIGKMVSNYLKKLDVYFNQVLNQPK